MMTKIFIHRLVKCGRPVFYLKRIQQEKLTQSSKMITMYKYLPHVICMPTQGAFKHQAVFIRKRQMFDCLLVCGLLRYRNRMVPYMRRQFKIFFVFFLSGKNCRQERRCGQDDTSNMSLTYADTWAQ